MLAGAVFLEQEDGAALDDIDAVIDEGADGLIEREFARLAVEHREEDHGEALLHRGVLVELVEDDLRLRAALEFDDDAHAVAVGFVAHVADVVDDLVVDQLGDALDELGFVDLVGDLGDDDRLFFLGQGFEGGAWRASGSGRGRSCRPAECRICRRGSRRWESPGPARA